MQEGTYNLSETQLYHMQRSKNAEAMKTGKRIPYHLQYARMVKEKQLVETPELLNCSVSNSKETRS